MILISDDEPLLASALARQLKRLQVETETDSTSQVVEISERLQPSLIVLDMVQAVSGLELLAALKQNPRTRHLRVLAVSAVEDARLRDACLAQGALGFQVKPFPDNFPRLLAWLAYPLKADA